MLIFNRCDRTTVASKVNSVGEIVDKTEGGALKKN